MSIYSIGMHLTLTDGVSSVLGVIAGHLFSMQGQVGAIQRGFASWNRALIGGAAIGGGLTIFASLKKITEHAKELSHELSNLKTLGLSTSSISGIQKQAQDMASGGGTGGGVRGTTQSGLLKLYGESYSLFGEEEAKKLMEPLAKFGRVFGANAGNMDKGREQLYELIRSGELMGKLVDEKTGHVSSERLLSYLDVAAKVGAATHGKVGPAQIFALAQQGGPALANMSEEGLLSMFMATQDMGGHRAGTALTALYQQMVGGMMTKQKAERLQELGLVGDYTTEGNAVHFKKGALDTEFGKAVGVDPLKAAEILKSTLEKHGIFGQEAQTKELFQILGRQTTQRLVSDMLRNLEQKSAERGRLMGAMGLAGQYDERVNNDMLVVENDMKQAWIDLMQAIAGPNAENVIAVMRKVTDGLRGLTDAIHKMKPETIQAITYGFAALAGVMTLGGMALVISALGPAGWLIAGLTVLGTTMVAFKPQLDQFVHDLQDSDFGQKMSAFFSGVKPALDGFVHGIQESGSGIKPALDGFVHDLQNAGSGIKPALDGFVHDLQNSDFGMKMKGGFDWIKSQLDKTTGQFVHDIQNSDFGHKMTAFFAGLKPALDGFMHDIQVWGDAWIKWLKDLPTKMWDAVKEGLKNAFAGRDKDHKVFPGGSYTEPKLQEAAPLIQKQSFTPLDTANDNFSWSDIGKGAGESVDASVTEFGHKMQNAGAGIAKGAGETIEKSVTEFGGKMQDAAREIKPPLDGLITPISATADALKTGDYGAVLRDQFQKIGSALTDFVDLVEKIWDRLQSTFGGGATGAGGGGIMQASYTVGGDNDNQSWSDIGRGRGAGGSSAHHGASLGDAAGRYRGPGSHFQEYQGGAGDLYDAIIRAEGTGTHGNPFDTSLGYTKSPKPLTEMTLNEALAWGEHIRQATAIGRKTNSSAKGAFQIVNTTMRAAMRGLGLKGNELFDQAHQKQMADWIVKHQGLGAWEGFKSHPREIAAARRALSTHSENARSGIPAIDSTLKSDRNRKPITSVPLPQKKQADPVIQFDAHLDGDVLARSSTRRQSKMAMFPTSSGDIDPYSRWHEAGQRFSDVG